MKNFAYYTPTRVIFGKGTEAQTGSLVKAEGATKVLIHYGGGSAVRSGLLARIEASLEAEGIGYVTLGGVVPNPRLSKVREGIALCKEEGVDFILAVGGGSVVDSAKGIGYALTNEGDIWDYYLRKDVPKACLPIGVVLTISAAGSEMSDSSVVTNEEGWLKRSIKSDYGRPKFAIMNPELTMTLPEYQTMSGATDILMHTMERYFCHEKDTMLVDELAEGLLRTVICAARVLLTDPNNYDARADLMWASSLSHNGLTGCGRTGDWSCHQLEHELGGMFDIAHGAGLAAVWASWARYVYKEDTERFAQFAVNVMGVSSAESLTLAHKKAAAGEPAELEAIAINGIDALEAFFYEIHMPISIAECGIELTEEQIKELAWKCSFFGKRTVGNVKALEIADMEAIYRMAK